jgi:Antirepressor regulating drug resistance, predicted signal transduction N-terminal membrane component
MLTEVFYWVFNMSVIAGLMGLIVLALRSIRRLPRFFAGCLWAAPLIRFWLPFSLPGRYSLMTLIAQFTTRSVSAPLAGGQLIYTNAVMGADSYFPLAFKTEGLRSVFGAASVVWLIGFAAGLAAMALLYCVGKARVRDAVRVSGNIYCSGRLPAPAVYGVFRPKIMLPAGVSAHDMRFILLHEQAHIRRKDNLWRVVALLTACLHWFNPLVWIFVRYCFTDMELACDNRALKGLTGGERKQYALSMVNFTKRSDALVSAFGGSKLRLRIEGILTYKKLSAASLLCFAALTAAALIVLLANAQG